ncbi:transposase family protein [Dactylosporangium sp. NBC_01737]|uniref:transposase family protein n=1 Tax=Dactylosporangium sp. NBC_01737 TaxID=2975959 RepID=UPI002E1241A1|nr:transposase family protein [Dactylosporangium sp. NBC_01737]
MHDQTVGGFFLPHLAGVVVERVESAAAGTVLFVRARAAAVSCPVCATVSTSVRSRYQRRLTDTPVGGRPVWLLLDVRRFNCRTAGCATRTFVEQIPGLTARRRQRSQPSQQLLHGISAALAGRAGVRLAARLTMGVSRSTLLRLLRSEPEQTLTTSPRVLGVDLSRPWDYPAVVEPGAGGAGGALVPEVVRGMVVGIIARL